LFRFAAEQLDVELATLEHHVQPARYEDR